MGKQVCYILGPAVYCRTGYCPSLGLGFFLCKMKWWDWMSPEVPSSGQVLRSCVSSVFPVAVRNSNPVSSLSSFFQIPSCLVRRVNSWCQSWGDRMRVLLSVPCGEIAGRKLIQLFTPDPPPQNIWQGRPLTSLLAPTCHRTCCYMIQSPISIKVNHPLANECTVNRGISWCFNCK